MIWLYIYLAGGLVAFFVICVIGFKKEMRMSYMKVTPPSSVIFEIAMLAVLQAMAWPFLVVAAIGYGFLMLLKEVS